MSAVIDRGTNVVRLDDWRENRESRSRMIHALQDSHFPGARPESVEMVLAYCEAANLDPMLKPVHIVGMWVKKAGTRDQYEWRDTVMPGISLWRIQASRSGAHAGTDEPEFGPMMRTRLGDEDFEHPEWCRVTVYKIVQGVRCAFTAREYWIENYTTAGRDTTAVNAMWRKRPRGQVAKCAEAQALRRAFPDLFGGQYTAEEMEGRVLDAEEVRSFEPAASREPDDLMPRAKSASVVAIEPPGLDCSTDKLITSTTSASATEGAQEISSECVTANMLTVLRRKASANNVADADICKQFRVSSLEKLPRSKINDAMKLAGGAR